MFSSKCSHLTCQIIKTKYGVKPSPLYPKKRYTLASLLLESGKHPFARKFGGSASLFRSSDELLKEKNKLPFGPGLEYFVANSITKQTGVKERLKSRKTSREDHPYLSEHDLRGDGKQGK